MNSVKHDLNDQLAYHSDLLQWPVTCVAALQERCQLLLLPQLLVAQCLDQLTHLLLTFCKAREEGHNKQGNTEGGIPFLPTWIQ